ncbi:alpha-L-rhamnosidase C-terminal domain-containing protein [Streptomyces sp. NPDC057950]|uniref:alpha-L-rhamnosidase C-terminal domain-containing protein n=1 Tax=Streptomyces sp. NPDC057950 TaxID=3346288 RepID=UPI0036F17C5C
MTTAFAGIFTAPATAANPDWRTYLIQPTSTNVKPVAASVSAGTVTNVQGVTSQGNGTTTLTVPQGGRPTTILLDYGTEVEGTPTISVQSHTGTPTLSLAFSEAKSWLTTSSSGTVTGDSGFGPRTTTIRVNSNTTLTGPLISGFRFETITLSTPGTVVLSGAGLRYSGGFLASAADYQGHFASSDTGFNRMFYDGAYTVQTNMQPAGVNGASQPSVLDGAKRDRAIWSGDLKIQGQNIANTLGTTGNNYVKQSLLTLITASPRGGGLNADTFNRNGPYSNNYSHWTLDAAVDYYRNTGDTAFARQVLPWLEGQLSYDTGLTDSTGLIVTTSGSGTSGGNDWDFYDGAKTGVVTAYNVLYYRALQDMAYLESNLGNSTQAATYTATATRVRNAINANLYNASAGRYYLSASDHTTLAQDGNSLAIVFGVAPATEHTRILASLRTLWGTHGVAPFSGTRYSNLVSPYVTGFEVQARYIAGDTAGAEQLMRLTWNQMIDPTNPYYTGTFWENYTPNGTVTASRTSLAHGWASGPTVIMTSYVLGVSSNGPGYSTFTVNPSYGSLASAEGTVPTPFGPINVSWTKNGSSYSLSVQAPPGTTATVVQPNGARATVEGGTHGSTRTLTG